MALKAQEIADAIYEHLKKDVDGNNFSKFYIGITNDIERRLFGEHNVPRNGHWRIHQEAINKDHAQAVEAYFLKKALMFPYSTLSFQIKKKEKQKFVKTAHSKEIKGDSR